MARSKRRRSFAPAARRVAFNDRRDFIDDTYLPAGASHIDATKGAPRSLVHRLRSIPASGMLPNVGVWGGLAPYRFSPVNTLRSALSLAKFPRPIPLLQAQPRFVLGMNVLPRLNRRASVCVSRLQRKQVLFARGIAGRRGSAPGPYHRNMDSQRSC